MVLTRYSGLASPRLASHPTPSSRLAPPPRIRSGASPPGPDCFLLVVGAAPIRPIRAAPGAPARGERGRRRRRRRGRGGDGLRGRHARRERLRQRRLLQLRGGKPMLPGGICALLPSLPARAVKKARGSRALSSRARASNEPSNI
jgi:hypothetical protein